MLIVKDNTQEAREVLDRRNLMYEDHKSLFMAWLESEVHSKVNGTRAEEKPIVTMLAKEDSLWNKFDSLLKDLVKKRRKQ